MELKTTRPAPGKRLTNRLVSYTVAIALVVGIASSAVSVISDYRDRVRSLEYLGHQILESVEKAAAHVVWNIDLEGGRELARGVLKYRSVARVEILDEGGFVLADLKAQTPPGTETKRGGLFGDSRIFERRLKHPVRERDDWSGDAMGVVRITIDPGAEIDAFFRHCGLQVVLEVLRSLVLAGVLLWLLHLYVTRGLLQIGAALGRIDSEDPARELIERPRLHGDDELGELVDRSNALLRAVGANISRRVLAEEALRKALGNVQESRNRMDAILRSIADGLLVTDLQNRIVLANPKAREMFGFALAEGALAPIESVIPERRLLEELSRILEDRAAEASVEWEIPASSREAVRVIQARIAPAPILEGMGKGVITTLRDVTREKASDRMKSEFISVAAHELNTPLTVVMGYAELLREAMNQEPLDLEQCREFVGTMYHKAEVVSHIVDDLLDLSRIETGQTLLLEVEPFDVFSTPREICSQFRMKYPERRIELDLEPSKVMAEADRLKMEQVWQNLISNALKYSPEGGPIRILGRCDGERVRFCVEDQGIGMTPEQIQRIFEKFYRVDTKNTAVGGLGLGMSIVKSIIDAHRGKIEIESNLGEGTRVHFALPLVPPR